MEEVSNFSPARAVPTTVKIPEPMTAPMPSAVSDQGPRVFCRQCSGSSESLISLSIDLVANSCFRSVSAPLLYHPAQPQPSSGWCYPIQPDLAPSTEKSRRDD